MAESSKTPQQKPKRPNKHPNHVLHKRQPQKLEVGKNVIYVSTRTSIKGLLERCTKLINNNENEIIIHCLGAAIQRGVLLALQVCERHVAFQHETKTFTTALIDDLEPAIDDADYQIQRRFNSALRIRVFRSDLLEQPDKQ